MAPSKEPRPEKLDAVVTSPVTRRKKPLSTKLRETFIGKDAKSVGAHILTEIIIPTIKSTITDIVSEGIEQIMYGGTRTTSRRSVGARLASTAYTNYSKVSTTNASRSDPRPSLSREARAKHDFDEIILASRAEAEEVINKLIETVGKYEQASVADLYDLLGITAHYTDNKWGWQTIEGMGVDYVRGGYLLNLPEPVPLREA